MTRARTILRRTTKWVLTPPAVLAVAVGAVVLAFAIQARVRLPELRPWHKIHLDEEFRAGRRDAPKTFEEYLKLEDRLFAELQRRIVEDPDAADSYALSRYRAGTVPEQLALDTRYNRSFELVPESPRGAVLLVHGLTDSPYSMRALAELFFAEGYHVVALRLPGHGTIPSGLCSVSWKDWYLTVELAARYTAARAGPGRPFLAGGYSTGAALLSLYAVRATGDPSLPQPDQLYLLSAAIGVSKFAVLTNVLAGLGVIPYFEKSKWLDVLPEYDPYKYNSFPVNAANQIYLLTKSLHSELVEAGEQHRLERMPRVLAFQSLVDATILASDVVSGLLARLPGTGNELVIFDVNRNEDLEALIAPGPRADLQKLNGPGRRPFRITVIGNRVPATWDVGEFTREAGSEDVVERDLPLAWPPGVLSLGHVALPFPIDDPVYGLTPAPPTGPKFELGALRARGEAGAMIVSLDTLARLRSNPFFDVIREKIKVSIQSPAP
jgi:alpha-beta hydrolase superfamily lysophospholipase